MPPTNQSEAGRRADVTRWDPQHWVDLPIPAFASVHGRLFFANHRARELGIEWPLDRGRAISAFLTGPALTGPALTGPALAETIADEPDGPRVLELRSMQLNLDGAPGWLTLCWDVTRWVRAERQLRYQADHDTLTGLLRRRAFLELAVERLPMASPDSQVALLVADMNDFKSVNDVHGHLVGDQVLTEIARRLRFAVRGHDLVARFGGDEFLVLATGLRSMDDIHILVDRIHRSFDMPVRVASGQLLTVSVTLGVAVQSSPPGDAGAATDRLLEIADHEVIRGKHRGADRRS